MSDSPTLDRLFASGVPEHDLRAICCGNRLSDYAGRTEPNGGPLTEELATVRIVERLRAEEIAGYEWAEWHMLSPSERFLESAKLWDTYLALGGSLEPEPDTQSPFFDPKEWRENVPHGRAGVHILRRSGNLAATWIS